MSGKKSSLTNILDKALIDGSVSIGDLILLEILQGIKAEREYNKTKTALATLEQYEMFGHNMVDKCVEKFRFLRKKGLTIRKTNDVIPKSCKHYAQQLHKLYIKQLYNTTFSGFTTSLF